MDIQQAAHKSDVSADTIRRWERLGMIPHIKRNAKGLRDFQPTDLKWVQYAKLLNQMNVSKYFQIEYVKLVELGKDAEPAREDLLKDQLKKLQDDHYRVADQIKQMDAMVKKELV